MCSGSAGNYNVIVTGTSGSLSHSATFSVTVQDFAITASPTTVVVNAGSPGSSTIMVSAENGFTGTVTLSQNGSLACNLSSTSIILTTTTTSGSTTLVCTYSTAGNNSVVVTGTSGSLSHTATVTFQVVDFTIAANPTFISTTVNVAGSSTITVTALNGFAGTINLSFVSGSSTAVVTLSVNSVALTSSTTSASVTLTVTDSASETFNVTVTGVSGSLSHSVTVPVSVGAVVGGFTITSSPSSANVFQGASNTTTITVTSTGFTGTVILTATTISGTTATLNPTSVTLGSSATSTLSITVTSSVAPGTIFRVNVTATGMSGSTTVVHTVTVTVTVLQPPEFVAGKLHWTHHLSLSKSAGVQTFTAKVTNFAPDSEWVVVTVSGCGDSGTACFTGSSAPMLLAPGASASITFTVPISSSGIGLKFTFLGQVFYGPTSSSQPYLSPVTKTGTFAVVA